VKYVPPEKGLDVPVVLFLFNRPELTARVFAAIRAQRPRHLLLVADGPRPDRPEDRELCAATRKVVETIDWPCEVGRNFSATNLSCALRIASGLDWVFSQAEEAIILEDDIEPAPSFFPYCAALLEGYRDQDDIAMISGHNNLGIWETGPGSYFFARQGSIWGWATWRRAWQRFDLTMEKWGDRDVEGFLAGYFPDPEYAAFLTGQFRRFRGRLTDTWDLAWNLSYILEQGLAIVPRYNLIANLGFGEGATHTLNRAAMVQHVPRHRMGFPLQHPEDTSFRAIDDRYQRLSFIFSVVSHGINHFQKGDMMLMLSKALEKNRDFSDLARRDDKFFPPLLPLRYPDETLEVLTHMLPQLPGQPLLNNALENFRKMTRAAGSE